MTWLSCRGGRPKRTTSTSRTPPTTFRPKSSPPARPSGRGHAARGARDELYAPHRPRCGPPAVGGGRGAHWKIKYLGIRGGGGGAPPPMETGHGRYRLRKSGGCHRGKGQALRRGGDRKSR